MKLTKKKLEVDFYMYVSSNLKDTVKKLICSENSYN